MSLNAFRKGQHIKIETTSYLILQKLSNRRWQLQNTATGEWCAFAEDDLLDRFVRNELCFTAADQAHSPTDTVAAKLTHGHPASPPPEMLALARSREQYLKEIDRRQPITITKASMDPLIRAVADRIKDGKPPSWITLWRNYRRWVAAGRDVRAIALRYADRGNSGTRMLPEVRAVSDQVINELYMTAERRRVPVVYLEIVRRLEEANEFRPEGEKLPIPSRSTIFRQIASLPPYDVMVARYGKRRADMEFRVSTTGPVTTRALERVVMDHTPSDIIVVDDNSMLPLGRPTITSALDEHTRCPMGFYAGFEPPSCLSVMRCLKHAILPKAYVPRDFPSIKNRWECFGVPELVVVDNPPEFHSSHFERACLEIGADIQYSRVLVPWYKGKLERFQGTLNHDLMQGNPGTTFSNILERDDYDPGRRAVILLSTLREMLHKWIIDVYLQTPHRGITDTPAHRWQTEMNGLPPPLPKSAGELDIVLGMTAQRVAFHYGIELEGLKYNGPELGGLRRRMKPGAKVEITFDPGDLGHINVFDPLNETYFRVPAVNERYANGLSLWQHRVIRRYAQRQLNIRTNIVALAQAKAEIRALVEHDFSRKSTRGRKRHARFMENHASSPPIDQTTNQPTLHFVPDTPHGQLDVFADDEILPVFEAALDLPRPLAPTTASVKGGSATEKADD